MTDATDDMEDTIIMESIKDDPFFKRTEQRGSTTHWVTRDGRKLKIKDMLSSHIKNCMRLLDSKEYKESSIYFIFKLELEERHGEK